MKVGTTLKLGDWFIKRARRNEWRVFDEWGDPLTSGTLPEMVARIERGLKLRTDAGRNYPMPASSRMVNPKGRKVAKGKTKRRRNAVSAGYTKRAIKREPGYPAGTPAPMYLDCGCGHKLSIDAFTTGATCPKCGTSYDSRGYILGSNPKRRRSASKKKSREVTHACFIENHDVCQRIIGRKLASGGKVTCACPCHKRKRNSSPAQRKRKRVRAVVKAERRYKSARAVRQRYGSEQEKRADAALFRVRRARVVAERNPRGRTVRISNPAVAQAVAKVLRSIGKKVRLATR